VAGGELHLAAIAHGQGLLLRVGVGLGQGTALEDGRAVGRLDDQLRLEEPGRILALLGLLLAVDQEGGDVPLAAALAQEALDVDIGLVGVGYPAHRLAGAQRHGRRDGLDQDAPPDQAQRAILVAVGVVLDAHPLVAAPARRELQGRGLTRDDEAQAQGGRLHGDRQRGRQAGLSHAILAVDAALVQLALDVVAGQRVVLVRLQGLAPRTQLTHQVAVAQRTLVDDLLRTAGRAEQVGDDGGF
jgi:hypothetical protein